MSRPRHDSASGSEHNYAGNSTYAHAAGHRVPRTAVNTTNGYSAEAESAGVNESKDRDLRALLLASAHADRNNDEALHTGRARSDQQDQESSFMSAARAEEGSSAGPSRSAASASGSAAKRQTKAATDDGDAPRAKRKKVAKACIFCKRSHMTCTENRPCERCIKRDIAHLCQDGPISGNSATPPKRNKNSSDLAAEPAPQQQPDSAPEETPPLPGPSRLPELDLDFGNTSSSSHYAASKQQDSSIPTDRENEQSRRLSQSSQTRPISTNSLLFGTSNLEDLTEQVPSASGYIAQPQARRHTTSIQPTSANTHSQSPIFDVPKAMSNGRVTDSPVTTAQPQIAYPQQQQQSAQAQQPSSNYAQSAQSDQQPSTTAPYNPFDILNQAYDFQYPSSQDNSNSLASLRLFATTADAQFHNLGQKFASINGTDYMLSANGKATSEASGNSEIDGNALDEFLKSLDEMYLNPLPDVPQVGPPLTLDRDPQGIPQQMDSRQPAELLSSAPNTLVTNSAAPSRSLSPVLGAGHVAPQTSTERFLLTAADQKEGTRDERLNRVIRAKYDAGLLRPFNYIKGYERLNTWMDSKWTPSGKHRTLRIISEFRPHFRKIAQNLTDMDLIFIEEAFERLLLDYDRVFSTMGIPACLWRRTGEIFKGNREFARLVGIPYEQLREGKLAIYEVMTEDSAVNFWEKYGSIAFDPAQKAVLTSCVLVDQTKLKAIRDAQAAEAPKYKTKQLQKDGSMHMVMPVPTPPQSIHIPDEAVVTCTFSFTIRRDAYHIPNAIVGNFMPYDPAKMKK